MMMIMYYAFNFMNDEFYDYNKFYDYNNSDDFCYNSTEKCNSYEYVLANFTQSSYLLSNQNQKIVDEFVYNNYLTNCINVLVVFFVTSTSLLFSILIVSICVYEKMINEFVEKYNENRECYEYDTYFFEYLDEFNELNNIEFVDDDSYSTYLNSLEYKYIKQKTPKGEILMNYNNSNSSFDYYCKKSNSIDFMYLDVVSRIYVVKYDCKNVYVDNYDNFELIKSYYANVSDNDSSCLNELKENNIFYNKVNTKNKTKQTIEYVSNKYKYRGTFDDFNNYCKINNYKINTQDLLENDIFTLQKSIETDLKNDDNNCESTLASTKNTKDISFKTFKNNLVVPCNN
jgi:hypothetical protein